MDEAQYLADRVAIIDRGQIVARGTPAELISTEAKATVRFRLPAAAPDLAEGLETAIAGSDGQIAIETAKPTELLYALTSRAHERGIELEDLQVTRPSLEDIYLRLVSVGQVRNESGGNSDAKS
jgi:ABC-2 type transport system ATP-binding protein